MPEHPAPRRRRALRAAPAVALLALLGATPCAHADDDAARAAFLLNCARCHGETGDGHGTETLDRPARSFRDGGFSFGNTAEAVFRTISHGIPGSPMPSFEALSESDRRALAGYVLSLGPPRAEASDEQTELRVAERAVVVRGLLPPISAAASEQPRGLLVGTPDGLTFEYRADELSLLGVRFGAFVRRTDWTGRGGTPLEPLGKVVALMHAGAPPASFSLVGGPSSKGTRDGSRLELPLHCELVATRVNGATCTLSGTLVRPDGSRLGTLEESAGAISSAFASGFVRRLGVPLPPDGALRVDLGLEPGAETLATTEDAVARRTWFVLRATDGEVRCLGVTLSSGEPVLVDGPHGPALELRALPGELLPRGVEIVTLLPAHWTDDDLHALLDEPLR
ncbi:MAG: cytochrome c [Planctomycetes bacterium]|nr:cytochrome c [Planctomycetota bacterium]